MAIEHFPQFMELNPNNLQLQLQAIRIIGCWISSENGSPLIHSARIILDIERVKGELGVTKEIEEILKSLNSELNPAEAPASLAP